MSVAEFVESYFDAWNHGDARRVADHLTANGTYCDIPVKQQHSRDELVAYLNDFFAYDNHQYELIGDILTGRDSIAFQYRVSPVDGADRDEFADGYFGAEFVTLDGDAAVRIADYYEMPGVPGPARPTSVTASGAFQHKYAKSGLSAARMEEFKRRLETLMRTEKAYLRSDLTLPKLAVLVDCSVNHLSQVINSRFGMSFFEFLNQYRIEYAKELLGQQEIQHGAILNVAFAVGFNSNSAFYSAFRKSSGQTPAQYRRTLVKRAHRN